MNFTAATYREAIYRARIIENDRMKDALAGYRPIADFIRAANFRMLLEERRAWERRYRKERRNGRTGK